jgi:hypothetical protein
LRGLRAPKDYRIGNVADHIRPVYLGMPNTVFYDRSNLRPSCRRHNLFKGHAENAACDEHDHAPGLPDADLRNDVLAAAIRTAEAVLREHGYREDAMELDQPLTERTHSATKS